jgi:catechol 2,3-dioxygenase-like lactoylglutathione lyase family enzyme
VNAGAIPTSSVEQSIFKGLMDQSKTNLSKAHLRMARLTNNLADVMKFYCDGLGFEVLYRFEDHKGFDGVMLGHRDGAYHLEFTKKRGHTIAAVPAGDNLLVFYIPRLTEWRKATRRLESLGFKGVKAFNPYWEKRGKTFEDPDQYRVVLQNASWP